MYRVVEGFTGLCRVYTWLYRVYKVVLGSTGLNRGLQGFIGFYVVV